MRRNAGQRGIRVTAQHLLLNRGKPRNSLIKLSRCGTVGIRYYLLAFRLHEQHALCVLVLYLFLVCTCLLCSGFCIKSVRKAVALLYEDLAEL
jgi:hypothetical protein